MPAQNNLTLPITVRDIVKILFRRKNAIITAFISCITFYFLGISFITPTFKATSKLLISAEKQVNTELYRDIGFAPKMEIGATPAEIIISEPVLEPVVKALNLDKRTDDYELDYCPPLKKTWFVVQKWFFKILPQPEKQPGKSATRSPYQKAVARLKNSISTTPVAGSRILKVSVTDISPEEAARISNAVVRSYVIFDIKQQIATLFEKYGEKHPIVRQLLDHIALLELNIGEYRLTDTDAIGPASVKIIEQASVPSTPMGISKIKLLLLTLLTGFAVSLAIGFAIEYLDQTVKSPDEAESLLALPVLGVLHNANKIAPLKNLHRFENAAQQIHLLLKSDKGNCLVFTGVSPAEDVESTVIGSARAYSQTFGVRTLLIDANLRSLHKNDLLKNDGNGGFVSVIRGVSTLDASIVQSAPHFWVLPSGTGDDIHPSIIFHTGAIAELLVQIRTQFDMVFIYAPDALGYGDAAILSKMAGYTVLVIAERRTRRQTILKAFDTLKKYEVSLLGSMVTNHEEIIPPLLYERL